MKSRMPLALLMSAVVGCTQPAAPPSAESSVFNADGAPTIQISVPAMTCEHCVGTVQETLAAQPGVKDVKVELAPKTATLAIDEDAFNADAAVAALVDLQFTDTKLVTDAAKPGGAEAEEAASDQADPSGDAQAAKG